MRRVSAKAGCTAAALLLCWGCSPGEVRSGESGHTDSGAGDPDAKPAADAAAENSPDSGRDDAGIGDGAGSQHEAWFSYPASSDDPDLALEEKVSELVASAVPGSQIRAAVYTWSRANMAEDFIAAHERGVDVRVVLGAEYNATETKKDALPDGHVIVCRKGGEPAACHGDATQGNKMFLFSELDDGSRDVVVQSSANLTRSQTVSNNSLVVVRDDEALYAAFRSYWDDLARNEYEPDYYRVAEGDSHTRAYFFPRGSGDGITGEGDTVWEIFDAIDCSSGSVLHIGQARFRWNRRGLAHKLVQMRSEGCEIHAVLEPGRTDERIEEMLTDVGASVTYFPRIHSKYFLLDGVYEDVESQWVWTGSQNFSGAGLIGNDNVILQLANSALYEAFLEDWSILQSHPDAYVVASP